MKRQTRRVRGANKPYSALIFDTIRYDAFVQRTHIRPQKNTPSRLLVSTPRKWVKVHYTNNHYTHRVRHFHLCQPRAAEGRVRPQEPRRRLRRKARCDPRRPDNRPRRRHQGGRGRNGHGLSWRPSGGGIVPMHRGR